MKKRLLSLTLIAALCLSLLPVGAVPALADAPSGQVLYVGGVQISSTGYWTTDSAGNVSSTSNTEQPSSGGYIHYNVETNTLTLHNATIKEALDYGDNPPNSLIFGAAIGVLNQNGDAALTIQLEGDNTIAEVGKGIYVLANSTGGASLTITGDGDGTLTASGSQTGILVQSNSEAASLNIQNATVTATNTSTSGDGIYLRAGGTSTASLTVKGGQLTATGNGNNGAGIRYDFGGSTSGLGAPSLTVSGNAIVKAINNNNGGGIVTNSSTTTTVTPAVGGENGGIVFDKGIGTVYGEVTLDESLTINQGETLTVPDGSSLNCNDKLTNSGTIIVEAGGKLDGTPTGNGTVIDKSSPISYLDENGTEQSCNDYEVVTANDTQWTDGWYVVNSDVTIDQRVAVSGDVKLILTDGHTLTVNGGIHVTGNDCFTVYGQENGNGKLTATATNNVGAGIGGNGSTTTSARDGENGGTIIIAGGTIEAIGGDGPEDDESPCGGAGIGNGSGPGINGGLVTIYGGKVNATGGAASAGIGGDGSTIQILGGTVDATSGGRAAAIGGTNGAAGTITITDSNVTANGIYGTGIGSGWEDHGGTITITNSTVTAIGGNGAGIGGGSGDIGSAGGNGGNVTIVNSTVTASSKEGDSIGAGQNGADPGTLTLSPADSKAIAAKAGADEASALTLNGSPFTAKTAVTDLVRGTKYFHSEPCDIHTVTVNDSYAQTTGAGNYAEGATVAIDAGTRSGYTFDGWTSADGVTFANAGSAQTTFTMPDKAVTVTANWKKNSGGGIIAVPSYSVSIDIPDNGSVSADRSSAMKGKTVTLTVTPDEGYVLDSLTVTDKNGDAVELTKVSDSEYTFTMPASKVSVAATFVKSGDEPAPTPSLPFVDVDPDAWYYDAVEYAYNAGLMTGTAADTFSPSLTTTRGMIVSILYRQEDEPAVTTDAGFADVVSGAYYEDAVNWAAEEGIVNGYSDTAFGPNDAITREQMAAILMNYAEYKGQDVTARANLSGYTDAADISAWAEDSMTWAVSEGLLKGMTDDTLAPQGNATRAQVAAILERFLER